MSQAAYLAIDWGTTNRRVFVMAANGLPLAIECDGKGVTMLTPNAYPDELAALRARYGALPIVAAGMVGSTRGWRDVPYVRLPAGVDTLAVGAVRLADEVVIVPGVALDDGARCDVMRGEEVQAIGAVLSGQAPADALFCQPGTHNKWIEVAATRITRFATAMTGEVFALLRDQSILSEMMKGEVYDGPAFRAGVREIARKPQRLLSELFGVRASVLLGRRLAEDGAAFASGLLIGCDVAASEISGRTAYLLSDSALGPLYAAAISECGGASAQIDGQAAFAAAIHSIWSKLS